MALKQTHIYRGHAILHHVFSTDQTEEKIERFTVSQPGKNHQVCTKPTLHEAKATVDEIVASQLGQFAVRSA
ncbi:MAG TPA: hypothetical protein VHX86_11755 [Tepidisphaeraceae bacterium]|jgi:hypothetical protein|nr:hypothetical protein [Tepidisphaeraceae bacterium]